MAKIKRVVQSKEYLTTLHNHSINHSSDRTLLILILFFYGINNSGNWKKSDKLQKVTTKYFCKGLFISFNNIKIVWKCSYEFKIEVLLWAPMSLAAGACAVTMFCLESPVMCEDILFIIV